MGWRLEVGVPSESYVTRNCRLKTFLSVLSRGFVMIDYFSSDKYPVSKSSLFSKDLHFPRIPNAFGCPVIKHRPLRPAEESEPFPGATETLLLDE